MNKLKLDVEAPAAAVVTVDSERFRQLLYFQSRASSDENVDRTVAALIAHIDAHTAATVTQALEGQLTELGPGGALYQPQDIAIEGRTIDGHTIDLEIFGGGAKDGKQLFIVALPAPQQHAQAALSALDTLHKHMQDRGYYADDATMPLFKQVVSALSQQPASAPSAPAELVAVKVAGFDAYVEAATPPTPPQEAAARDDLLPCPFCGNEPISQEIEAHSHSGPLKALGIPDHGGSYTIECPTSGCCGMIADTKVQATAAWNRRAALAAPAAQVAVPELLAQAIEQVDGCMDVTQVEPEDAAAWQVVRKHIAAAPSPAQAQPITCQIYGHVVGHCGECNVGEEAAQDVAATNKVLADNYLRQTCGTAQAQPVATQPPADAAVEEKPVDETPQNHANNCTNDNCEWCEALLEHYMACDECGHVGAKNADGWADIGADARVLCKQCAVQPSPAQGEALSQEAPEPVGIGGRFYYTSKDLLQVRQQGRAAGLEEAAKVAESVGRPVGAGDGCTYAPGTSADAARAIRALNKQEPTALTAKPSDTKGGM
jgi:hypothetical protein